MTKTIFTKSYNFARVAPSLSSDLHILLHICDTSNYDYQAHTIFRVCLIDFQLNTDFPSQFCVFYRKIKDRFLKKKKKKKKKLFKRAKTQRVFFFLKTIGSNNSYTLIENDFRFLR